MAMTNPVINELMTLISKKKTELYEFEEQANQERKQLEERLAQERKKKEADIQAVERTIELYQNGKGPIDHFPREEFASIKASELRGMKTQMAALDYIADKSQGRIKTSLAKRLLIEAGLTKGNPRYLQGSIYALLQNSGRYEWSAPGEFRKIQPPT